MNHALNHFEEYSDGLFGDSVLFGVIRIGGFMNDAIAKAKFIHHRVDELSAIVAMQVTNLLPRLPFQHGNHITYSSSH
ncbi:hypothetical protein AN958_04389 [Leucoagaricus sp. SymC.cos]|nr:hypothetical protein AN958_04389 [Leucoagaricus sp. SymC.cos]